MDKVIDGLFVKELDTLKKDVLFLEIKLAEHILSTDLLDLSFDYAVTFAKANLAYAQFKVIHTKEWAIEDKPWWVNDLGFNV